MHCSQKISNRNNLQFRRYGCLNITNDSISVSLHLHFQLWKCKVVGWTQIWRVRGMVNSFAKTKRGSHCSVVNAWGTNRAHSFYFFQIIRQNAVNDGFWYPVLSHIILKLAWWSSFKTAATRATFSFVFIVPGLLLCVFNRLLTHRKPAMPSKYHNTQHERVTKCFYKHFPHFRSRKSRFTTKF